VSTTSFVSPPELDRRYPVVVRGDGVWLEDSEVKRYLDAMSGGSMAATLGHGRSDLETHEPLRASGVDVITANCEYGGSPIGS
jgi:adenosylmethionine-8-amino-7-oxononanoate aminotransferase